LDIEQKTQRYLFTREQIAVLSSEPKLQRYLLNLLQSISLYIYRQTSTLGTINIFFFSIT